MDKKRQVHTVADLLKDQKPETAESGYRRGYRDGWVIALNTFWDLCFSDHLSQRKAYNRMWAFWQHELLDWTLKAEEGFKLPPGLR